MRSSIFAGLDCDVDLFFRDDAQLADLFDQAFEFRHPRGCCLRRSQLMDAAYPDGVFVDDRTVDSHISKLRKKLEAAGIQGVPLSVWGVGYRLGDDV